MVAHTHGPRYEKASLPDMASRMPVPQSPHIGAIGKSWPRPSGQHEGIDSGEGKVSVVVHGDLGKGRCAPVPSPAGGASRSHTLLAVGSVGRAGSAPSGRLRAPHNAALRTASPHRSEEAF